MGTSTMSSVLTTRASAAAMREARLARFGELETHQPERKIEGRARQAQSRQAQSTSASVTSRSEGQWVDATALFRMGYEPDSVGRALVKTKGDASAALELLRTQEQTKVDAPADVCLETSASSFPENYDDEEEELALALKMSLENPTKCQRRGGAKAPATDNNPLWAPPRYLPTSGSGEVRTLSLVEQVQIRDGGYAWQPARAFLDTGNQLMTIVDARFAARHAI